MAAPPPAPAKALSAGSLAFLEESAPTDAAGLSSLGGIDEEEGVTLAAAPAGSNLTVISASVKLEATLIVTSAEQSASAAASLTAAMTTPVASTAMFASEELGSVVNRVRDRLPSLTSLKKI